jgi:hypothetical protein
VHREVPLHEWDVAITKAGADFGGKLLLAGHTLVELTVLVLIRASVVTVRAEATNTTLAPLGLFEVAQTGFFGAELLLEFYQCHENSVLPLLGFVKRINALVYWHDNLLIYPYLIKEVLCSKTEPA